MNVSERIPILICTGATGGHFYPALATAETFQKQHPQVKIHFLMNKALSFVREEMANRDMELHLVEWSGLKRLLSFGSLPGIWELFRAILETRSLIGRIRPRLIIGFGSYSSVLGVFLGICDGIPCLLHEQNAVAGKANEFLGFWTDRIAVSFPETLGVWPKDKVLETGYPVRNNFLDLKQEDIAETGRKKFHILILGGSQGARVLNRMICQAMDYFTLSEKENFAVTHSIGNEDCGQYRESYEGSGVEAEVFKFSKEIGRHFSRADLVIARAGAGTIFELAAVGKPAILIPYPYAGAHQRVNAQYLVDRHMAEMIEEVDLTPMRLYKSIHHLMNSGQECARMGKQIQSLHQRDAGETMVEEGWKLICKKI